MKRLTLARRNPMHVYPNQPYRAGRRNPHGSLLDGLPPRSLAQIRILFLNMATRQQPASMPMMMHEQDSLAIRMKDHRAASDMTRLELVSRERRRGLFEQRQNQFPALFFFRRRSEALHERDRLPGAVRSQSPPGPQTGAGRTRDRWPAGSRCWADWLHVQWS